MANEWQIEAVSAEILTRATAVPLQVEAVSADVLVKAINVPLQVESVSVEVLTSAQPSGTYINTVLADAPLAWWRMNDAAGWSLTADQSGKARHGTNVGSFGSTASTITDSSTALTDAANAYSYITSPSWATGLGDFTVEGWFKTTAGGNQAIITMDDINQSPGAVGRKFALYLGGGQMTFMCFTNAGGYPYIQSPLTTYNDGQWHHVMATRSGVVMTLFMEGAQVATTTQTGVTWTGSNVDLLLGGIRWTNTGASGNSYLFNGTLDELSIYGTALSSTRVNAHYTAGAPTAAPATPSFTGWGRPI